METWSTMLGLEGTGWAGKLGGEMLGNAKKSRGFAAETGGTKRVKRFDPVWGILN